MNNVNFKGIVASMVLGNHQAFRIFYDFYYLKVYRFVHYFLSNSHDYEAVVSNAFCIVWEKRQLLEKVENIEAYLYRISRHESFSLYKKEKEESLVSIDEILIDLPVISQSVEDAMTESEMMEVYQLAINK